MLQLGVERGQTKDESMESWDQMCSSCGSENGSVDLDTWSNCVLDNLEGCSLEQANEFLAKMKKALQKE